MRSCTAVVLALMGWFGTASNLAAQSEGTFAIGGNFRVLAAAGSEATGSASPGLLWRFGHDEGGWGLNYGLNWYNTDLQTTIGGESVTLGDLRVRPFMVGYGYKRIFGRTSVTWDAIGGIAITSFKMNPRATDLYYTRLGARTVDSSVSITPVVKPEMTVWFDLSPKVGMQINGGYLFARPKISITSSLGDDARRYRADMIVLQMGLVYSIF